MVLGGLSLGWVAGIALAASGMLVALHFLRIQPRQQQVLTLLFWRQVQEKHQTPSLFHRFRNLWTLLLLLLIVATICTALLGMRQESGQSRVVMVVDAGMSMAASTKSAGVSRMDEARVLARRLMGANGSRPMAVVVSDDRPRVVAGFEEPEVLRARAVDEIRVVDVPAAGRDALGLAQALLGDQPDGRVIWVTDRSELPAGLTAGQQKMIERYHVGDAQENAAIVSCVYAMRDASLRVKAAYWGAGDATLRLQASAGGAVVFSGEQKVAGGKSADFVVPLAADGAKVQLKLSGAKGIAADDVADVMLPKPHELRFVLDKSVPRALELALRALGQESAGDGAIVVTGDAQQMARDAAIVVLSEGSRRVPAGETVRAADSDRWRTALNFEQAQVGDGPDLRGVDQRIEPVLLAGDAVVAGIRSSAAGKTLCISSALFERRANVATRAAFVVFLDQMAREIRGGPSDRMIAVNVARTQADPEWLEKIQKDAVVRAVAGDRESSDLMRVADSTGPVIQDAGWSWRPEVFEILLVLSVVLLITEAFLSIRGRIV